MPEIFCIRACSSCIAETSTKHECPLVAELVSNWEKLIGSIPDTESYISDKMYVRTYGNKIAQKFVKSTASK